MSRNRKTVTRMNLTSLMDGFTILVVFLLVNSASSEVLETPKQITLPDSVVEAKPRETVVIFITQEAVLVQGEAVALMADILESNEQTIDAITDRLATLKDNVIGISTHTVAESQEITILADRTIPFSVVKKIMATCTGEGFGKISLAVIQKASQQG